MSSYKLVFFIRGVFMLFAQRSFFIGIWIRPENETILRWQNNVPSFPVRGAAIRNAYIERSSGGS